MADLPFRLAPGPCWPSLAKLDREEAEERADAQVAAGLAAKRREPQPIPPEVTAAADRARATIARIAAEMSAPKPAAPAAPRPQRASRTIHFA